MKTPIPRYPLKELSEKFFIAYDACFSSRSNQPHFASSLSHCLLSGQLVKARRGHYEKHLFATHKDVRNRNQETSFYPSLLGLRTASTNGLSFLIQNKFQIAKRWKHRLNRSRIHAFFEHKKAAIGKILHTFYHLLKRNKNIINNNSAKN